MRSHAFIRILTSFAAFTGLFAAAPAGAEAREPADEKTSRAPEGWGRLRNVAQGLCLDVAGWAADGNANVRLWDCNDDPDQIWSFTERSELENVLNDEALDPAGQTGAEGADVRIFRAERLNDQRWELTPRGTGTFELRNVKGSMCLDVSGRSGARGDDVLLWSCDGGRDQLWTWEPYPDASTHQVYKLAATEGQMGAVSSTSGNSSASPFKPSRATEKPAR